MRINSRFFKVHSIPLLLFILVLLYVVYRAVYLNLTHDEALTYTIVRGEIMWRHTANNHWLNTILVKASWPIFGVHEWVLRLPNILALCLYAWAGKRLFYKEEKPLLLYYLFFAALLCNQFVLDFFGLSRGYGLAQAFLTLSLSYFLPWIKQKKKSDLIKFLLCCLLSFYANFAFFFPIAVLGLLAFFFAWDKKEVLKKSLSNYLIPFVLAAVLFLPGIKALMGLNEGGQLYIGQNTSLFDSTFFSYLMMTIPWLPKYVEPYWFYYVNVFLIGTALFLGWRNKSLLASALVPLGTGILILLMHVILKMNFPVERTIIYLSPLFLLLYFQLSINVSGRKWLEWPVKIIVSSLLLFQFISFKAEANLKNTISWKSDAEVLEVLGHLEKERQKGKKLEVGIPWYLEPSMNYYRKQNRLDWLSPLNREGIDSDSFNIYILEEAQLLKMENLEADSLHFYPVSRLWMYRNKSSLNQP